MYFEGQDAFVPLVHAIKDSDCFDEEDVNLVNQTHEDHQKFIQHRVAMDEALHQTRTSLEERKRVFMEFRRSAAPETLVSPAYKQLEARFMDKYTTLKMKYEALLERREQVHGKLSHSVSSSPLSSSPSPISSSISSTSSIPTAVSVDIVDEDSSSFSTNSSDGNSMSPSGILPGAPPS